MRAFDIVFLFTRVPLSRNVHIIPNKMYRPSHTCLFSNNKPEEWCDKCQQRYELECLLEISTKNLTLCFMVQCTAKGNEQQ